MKSCGHATYELCNCAAIAAREERIRFRWHHGEKPPGINCENPLHRSPDIADAMALTFAAIVERDTKWHCGWLFRPGSLWVGVHYAAHNKRWCINLVPCVTFWITAPGGNQPR